MSDRNSRWELWGSITVNASSAVTAARVVTSQTGKFMQSLGATGISRAGTGVWMVHLRPDQGVSGPDCYAQVTPRHTQVVSGTAIASGAISMACTHDTQFRKRITIVSVGRHAATLLSAPVVSFANVPFDFSLFRRTA